MLDRNFIIGLECKRLLSPNDIDYAEYEFDEEYQNITSVLYDLSESFYEREIVLVLKICDHSCINLGVELCILLEELHNFICFANDDNKVEFNLWFYEQGGDRLLSFKKAENGRYILIFNDNDISGFKPLNTTGSILDLNLMLYTLFSKVRLLAYKMCPSIAKNPLFSPWIAEIENTFAMDASQDQ
ncbi:hypothetical protein [Mucilaginibacter sp.]|uniref:hypothetical protein n=1 Tax=Mucilaginibacter sp. TaxID=1882438 RepID=UPI0025CCA715|nr:hypothetical protein [Mucilaginibacter sp.]